MLISDATTNAIKSETNCAHINHTVMPKDFQNLVSTINVLKCAKLFHCIVPIMLWSMSVNIDANEIAMGKALNITYPINGIATAI